MFFLNPIVGVRKRFSNPNLKGLLLGVNVNSISILVVDVIYCSWDAVTNTSPFPLNLQCLLFFLPSKGEPMHSLVIARCRLLKAFA